MLNHWPVSEKAQAPPFSRLQFSKATIADSLGTVLRPWPTREAQGCWKQRRVRQISLPGKSIVLACRQTSFPFHSTTCQDALDRLETPLGPKGQAQCISKLCHRSTRGVKKKVSAMLGILAAENLLWQGFQCSKTPFELPRLARPELAIAPAGGCNDLSELLLLLRCDAAPRLGKILGIVLECSRWKILHGKVELRP